MNIFRKILEAEPRKIERPKKQDIKYIIVELLQAWLLGGSIVYYIEYKLVQAQALIQQLSSDLKGATEAVSYILKAQIAWGQISLLAYWFVCRYVFYNRKHRWLESTILLMLALCLFATHKGQIYLIQDIFVDSTIYEEYYVETTKDSLSVDDPSKLRNLITIYIESGENTYSDLEHGGAFDKNYIPELTKLALEDDAVTFSNTDKPLGGAISAEGSNQTSLALISTTSGVPYIEYLIGGNNAIYNDIDTLGDILDTYGYKNLFICGTYATFGDREKYFKSHKYDVLDVNQFVNDFGHLGCEQKVINNFGGIEDRDLFEYSKQYIPDYTKENKRFNISILTLDTHFPFGHVCEDCDTAYTGYGQIINCTNNKVYDFIQWCKEQPWYDNTTILITGDHDFMTDQTDLMIEHYSKTNPPERQIYHTFLNSAFDRQELDEQGLLKNRQFTQVDMFPTILSQIGFKVNGGCGLGTDLTSGEPTVMEELGLKEYNRQLILHSKYFIDNIRVKVGI